MNESTRSPAISLRRRLQRINLIALGSGMAVVAVLVVLGSFAVNLHDLIQGNQTQARILAENLEAPVAFHDIQAAHDVLKSLRNQDEIHVQGSTTRPEV